MSTYTPISTQTLSSAANSITFSGIPQTYTDLKLVMANAKATNAPRNVLIRVGNGSVDTASNYSHTNLGARSLSTTPFSQRESNQTSGKLSWYTAMTTAQAQMSIVDIMNYSNTTTNKTMLCSTRVQEGDGTYSGVEDLVILWRSTSAINVISVLTDVADTFQSGTTFTLYGIGAGSPKAFGGDEVRTDGTYWYHIYRSSGVFAPMTALTNVDCLIVAGGGGGSDTVLWGGRGGAGGAGGLLYYGSETPKTPNGSALSLIANTNYAVTIGAGGVRSGYTAGPVFYGKGNNTSFGAYTATGGGYGGPNDNPFGNGGEGGSGGGSWYGGTAGAGTSGQGNAGGNNTTNPNYGGGGGGGAGAVGGNGNTSTGGNGGNGLQYSISGTATYYAGGGSGDIWGNIGTSPGTAGLGGGGTGRNSTTSYFTQANASANTGGGGGSGGLGGSGIVIVRYAV
jgi:hypothetical protein